MDRDQEEMQNVGFFGLFKESFKTIFSCKKIFAQISLTFILPLSFIYLVHILIADAIDWRIENNDITEKHNFYQHRDSSVWFGYWIFKFAYLTFFFLFSLLSTAAVVYTIATVYTGGDVTFKKVLKIMPIVWKRLAVTFLWSYFIFFIYNVLYVVTVVIWATTMSNNTIGIIVFVVLNFLYSIGFIYLIAVWQLASVVTVLEKAYGLKAMTKGNNLIKGKRWLSWVVFFTLYWVFSGILTLFYVYVWNYTSVTIIMGLVCLFLLMNLFLIGYVAQTMLYLVCKSHHHQPIDKEGLSTQLGGYLDQFSPGVEANKDIELGKN